MNRKDGQIARWMYLASIALRKEDASRTDCSLRERRKALQERKALIAERTKELIARGATQ